MVDERDLIALIKKWRSGHYFNPYDASYAEGHDDGQQSAAEDLEDLLRGVAGQCPSCGAYSEHDPGCEQVGGDS